MQFKTKMILIGIIPLLISMSVIAVSTFKIQSTDLLSTEIIQANLKNIQLKNELNLRMLEIQRKLWMGNALDADKRARKEMMFQTEELILEFIKNKNELIAINEKKSSQEVNSLSKAIDDFMVPVKESIQLMLTGSAEDNLDAKEVMLKKFPDKVDALSFSMNQFSDVSNKINHDELHEINETKKSIYILIFSLFAILLLFSIFGILYFSKSISKSLSEMVQELSEAIQNTADSSEQILQISQVIASNSTEQATAIQQTVAAMEEISAAVKNNSDQAQTASTASRAGTEKANLTVESINILAKKMDYIQESSRKVEEVISVIDDIAFQTNLLALNAAVEAARAGEQGKGFAVVADAVRTLAAKTADSAKIVSQLINTTTSQVSDGVRSTHENSDSLLNIVEEIKKISKMNDNIASASTEQSQGVQEINRTLQEFDQATQKNSISAEEAEKTAKNLEAQSRTLKEIIKKIHHVMYGAA